MQRTRGQISGPGAVVGHWSFRVGILATLVFTLVPGRAFAQSFRLAPTYATGQNPLFVAVGDFNGDGDQDMAIANNASNDVSILLGEGTGAFGAALNFTAGSFPRAIAVGDFDGDAQLDLAVANYGSNNTSILLGDGMGGFGAAVSFAAGVGPSAVVAADLDGDADADLAVANFDSSDVSILLGDGAGSFAAPSNYGAGTNPRGLVLEDFDGDTQLDLAVANGDSNDVSVLLGDGTGSFGAAVNFGAGTRPFSVAVADFNADGDADLAVANNGSNNVSILPGDGTGAFGAPTSYSTGLAPRAVGVGDFNGDGNPDLAVANNGPNTVSIRLGNGAGGFGGLVNYGAGSAPSSLAVADLDGDTKPDLAVANTGSDNASVLIGTGVGAGAFIAPLVYTVGAGPKSVAVGDFNEDGRDDVAAADSGPNNVAILLGNASGGFAPPAFYAAGGDPISVAVGYLDADAHLDLAVANSQDDAVSILLGNGAGSFGASTTFAVGLNPYSLAVGDLNGDAKADLAVANFISRDVSVLLGDGTGGFGPAASHGVGLQPAGVVIGSFDSDGNPDLAVANLGSNDVSILLGDGAGGFAGALSYSVGLQPRSLALGDFNRDAKTDLAVTNMASNSVSILLGDGLGAFSAPLSFAVGQSPFGLAVGDFNGDSLQDLAVANFTSENVALLVGNGTGVFASPLQLGVGKSPSAVAVGDFNGDAKADLSVANQSSDSVWLLLNTTIFQSADLAVTKDDGQTETAPGAPISYAISVTNNGPNAVSSVIVTDEVPPAILSPVFTPDVGSYDNETGEWTGLSLAAGQSATLTLDGTIDSNASGSVVNTATVAPPVGVGDPLSSNNSATDTDILHGISIDDQAVTEGDSGGTALFSVSLSALSSQTISVSYATANGTATAGSDYTAVSGTLTFAPGTLTQPIAVPLTGDPLNEVNETFFVELSGASGAQILDGEGLGTIVDDDAPPSLAINDVAVAEGNAGNTAAVFTVSLSAASGQTVTVAYATADDTATAGSDYTAASGTLSISAGALAGTIAVQLTGDVANEENEGFSVSLSNPSAATIGDGLGLGTILDDDAQPLVSVDDVQVVELAGGTTAAFTVSLSAPSGKVVTVAYATADGTAAAGADYAAASGTITFPASLTAQTVAVPILADATLESTESYFVNLSAPTNASLSKDRGQGWILDQSAGQRLQLSAVSYTVGEAGKQRMITVKRVGGATGTVTVDYEASDGTALSGQDYTAVAGTLTFAPGVLNRTFAVPITNDTIVDGSKETVLLKLTSAAGGGVLGAPSAGLLTILDNDAGGKLALSAVSYNVDEAGPMATITVKRTKGAASSVTVQYATTDATAGAGVDYTATAGTLTFDAGVLTRTFAVPILEDSLDEGDEAFTVSLSNPSGGASLSAPSTATVTILENELTLQFSGASYIVGEAGSAKISVKRSGSTAATVAVSYATSDGTAVAGTDYTATSGVLTFANNVTIKTIIVPIKTDTLQEGIETVSLNLSNPTGGAALGQPNSATLSINDNDVAGTLYISAATHTVSEKSAVKTITVKRTGGKASGVTVDYATSDGTAVAGVDYTPSSGTLSFGPNVLAKTFTVPILNDGVPGPDETVNLTLSNPTGGASLGTPASAVLSILSDDPIVQFSAVSYSMGEKGPLATITVQRLGPTTPSVSVQYATADGTATAGSDYTASSGTLSFASKVVKLTFTVPITDDALVEPTETVQLSLSDPGGGAMLGARSAASLNIVTDNPMLQFSAATYTVSEKTAKATITVTRSAPTTGSVTVDYATSNGTAFAGADYSATSGTLSFAPKILKKTFTISITSDTLSEASETVNLTLSSPTGDSFLGPNSAAVLTITNDDVAGAMQFSAPSYSVSETGPTATIMVTRTGGMASAVTVDYAATPGSAVPGGNFIASSGTLVFGSGELSKTFTVLILDDQAASGNKTVNLSLSNPGGGGSLGAQTSSVLWIADGP